jgi:hypothetical protein
MRLLSEGAFALNQILDNHNVAVDLFLFFFVGLSGVDLKSRSFNPFLFGETSTLLRLLLLLLSSVNLIFPGAQCWREGEGHLD